MLSGVRPEHLGMYVCVYVAVAWRPSPGRPGKPTYSSGWRRSPPAAEPSRLEEPIGLHVATAAAAGAGAGPCHAACMHEQHIRRRCSDLHAPVSASQ